MIYKNIQDFFGAIDRKSCLLGLDFGTKKIGLAISDMGLAVPHSIITRNKSEFMTIAEFIAENNIKGIVIGMPTGQENICRMVMEFAEKLQEITTTPVSFYDESYTSFISRYNIKESGLKKNGNIDSIAACYILQNSIDFS